MEDPRILVAAILVLVYALISRSLGRRWISMPAAMVILGYLVGTNGMKYFSGEVQSSVVRDIAEAALALMLFHDAVRIDLRALTRGFSVPLRLLGIGLPLMIMVGASAAWFILPGIGIVGAVLVAIMLAPTDAALGEEVVTDKRLPVRIRQGLNVESGLNDGLTVPIFIVALAVATDAAGWEAGALASELAHQIGFGILGGLLVGGFGGLLFQAAAEKNTMIESWRRIAILAIAIGCYVCAAALGGSGFIGAFSGGILFGLGSQDRTPTDNAFTGYLGTSFDALSFMLLGALLLPVALKNLSWTIVLYPILSLILIRPLVVAAAMIGSRARWQTVSFIGWFGPRGLATVVFTVLVFDANIANGDIIATIAIVGVTFSVFAHGLSAPPLVKRYSAWWDTVSGAETKPMEGHEVAEHAHRDSALMIYFREDASMPQD